MRETLEAIDRALAAPPDPHRALTVSCGRCGASVPFHADTDVSVIARHKQWKGGCTFAGHRICQLPVSIRIGPAGTVATCSSCGHEASGGADDRDLRLQWARGCPKCQAGAVSLGMLPLKAASYELGKSERTVLRWARARGAARRDGGRWLIAVGQLLDEAA